MARYHRQFSFVLGFVTEVPRPDENLHALVNTDGGHAAAWLSFEHDKPGHVPPGQSVVVVQMAPWWSEERYEANRESLLPEVMAAVRTVLRDLPDPDWWDFQRWGFAHPVGPVDTAALPAGEAVGLFLAGDGLAGRGRVPLALKSGLATARRILRR